MMYVYFFIFVTIAGILIYCLPPTVGIGDIAELVGAASTLGIAHSPGYPLFCNVYKIGTTVLPFGEYGYKSGVISVLLYLSTCLLVGLTINKLTKNNNLTLFAISYYFSNEILLKQGIIGEVFALHNFLVILIIYWLSTDIVSFEKKLYVISLLAGMGLGNQHVIVLVYPGLLLWFIYKVVIERQNVNMKNVLLCLIFFLLGLTVYLYVVLRATKLPLYSWEDPRTFDRFLYLVLRGRYGTFSLAQGGKMVLNFESLYSGIKMFFHIIGSYHVFLFIISILFLALLKKNKEVKIILAFCILTFFLSGPFFVSITGLKSATPHNVYIVERLITTAVICMILIVSLSLAYIRTPILIFLLIVGNFYLMCKNLTQNCQRTNFFVYDYVNNLFRNIPPDSILFSDRADETEFLIAYFQRLLNYRKDVEFIDCNASVTRSIYGEEYYKIWGQPRLKIRTAVEKEIINNTKRKVYYSTVLPQQTDIPKFKFGLLHDTKNPTTVVYNDIFLFRNRYFQLSIREQGLYITHLSLLGAYYLYLAEQNFQMINIAKKYYTEMFYITGDVKCMYYIPYYFYSKGEFSHAVNEYLELLSLPVKNYERAEILSNLGIVYEHLRQLDNAEKCYLESIKFAPEHYQAYYNLGSLYWRIGRKNDAVRMFQKYLVFDPDNVEVRKYISFIGSP